MLGCCIPLSIMYNFEASSRAAFLQAHNLPVSASLGPSSLFWRLTVTNLVIGAMAYRVLEFAVYMLV